MSPGPARFPIVGVGAVASVGSSAQEIYERLCAGVSGLAPMRAFNQDWYATSQLYEIDDRGAGGDLPGRATRFLCDALREALADAGLGERLDGIPVLIGSGLRETRSVELWWRDQAEFAADDLHFGTELRRRFGALDTLTLSNACCASLYTLAMATDLLAAGEAETVVVAGTDSIGEAMFAVADRVQSIPPDAVRPFDTKRRGTLQGEGAAAVVLRREARPGDRVHGWVRGVGVNCDAFHPTAPDPTSIAAAIRDAHARGGVVPADIGLMMLHGTGTYANDKAEAEAIRAVFGEDSSVPLMTALKSTLGHTAGAAGLHGLVTALYGMRDGRIPPTPTLDDPIDEAAGFRIVRGGAAPEAAAEPVRFAQVNAFGFGGVNAVAIVEAENG